MAGAIRMAEATLGKGAAQPREQRLGNVLLAFTAGFVDTCGFVALFGLFTAHVTGNFILIGASIVQSQPGIFSKLLAFPVFITTVAVARAYLVGAERRHRDVTRVLLFTQALFLTMFLALGLAASPVKEPDALLVILAGMAGVTAMAIQNVASHTVFAAYAPSTVMTGNVTRVVMDLVDVTLGGEREAAKSRLRKMVPPVCAFAIAAIGASFGFVWTGFWCLLVPIVAVTYMVVRYRPTSSQ
jgi:uncharacterized membrane protein YoaK (UPF0700 family)